MKKVFLASLIAATAVFSVDQTHYDLIRPVYPMTWDDASAVENGGTVYSFSKFVPPTSENSVRLYPADGAKPAEFAPNGFISDTLNQAFIDALSLCVSDIRVNQAGYLPNDPEQLFYYIDKSGKCDATYSVVDTDGNDVATGGTFTTTGFESGYARNLVAYEWVSSVRYSVSEKMDKRKVCKGKLADMAGLPTNARLRVKVGKELSSTFIISDEVYSMVRDASLKFFGAQRSGNSDSWFHGPSHMKDGDGALTGGWYDSGDYVKFSRTMAFAFMVLSVMSTTNPELDDDHYAYNHNEVENTDGIPDVLREAKHGADFFLRSFVHAKGVVDDMVVTVGDFIMEHEVWNHCDSMDTYARAPERTLFYGELGSDASSNIATGLALLSKAYAKYDKDFADSCLMVAEKLYAFAKELKLGGAFPNNQTPEWDKDGFYPRNPDASDELAMAAIALHYATYETTQKMDYLDDAIANKEIGDNTSNSQFHPQYFDYGWFAYKKSGFGPGGWTTDYDNIHVFPLYAFYKFMLVDEKTSEKFGLSKEDRLKYIEIVIATMLHNLADSSNPGAYETDMTLVTCGEESCEKSLPGSLLKYNGFTYALWESFDWGANFYGMGPAVNLLLFADIAKDLEKSKIELPRIKNVQWHYEEPRQVVVNWMNYVLGMNKWDISLMIGVGDKNESHIHNRISNPELSNLFSMEEYQKRIKEFQDTLQWDKHDDDYFLQEDEKLQRELSKPGYRYRSLTGALMGGRSWKSDTLISNVENYVSTEACTYSGATVLSVLMLLSKEHSTAAAPDTSKSDSSSVKTDTSTVKTDTTVTKDSTDKKNSTDKKGSTDKKDSGDKKDKDKKDNVPESPKFVQNLNVVKLGSMLEVNYSLNVAAPATVKLVSVSGNVVRNYNGGNLGAGRHTISFNMSEVPAGIYIVKVGAGNLSETKMIKLAE